MPRRLFELAVRARRFVSRSSGRSRASQSRRLTGRRQIGDELTQFSFRLAFVIDLAYVGVGALGGAAIGRATSPGSAGGPARVSCADATNSAVRLPNVACPATSECGSVSPDSLDSRSPIPDSRR